MENATQKVRDWWEVADRTQRYVTVFGASALVLLLVLTAYVMSRPRMTPLYSGLNPEERGEIVSVLRQNSIPVELKPGGTVMVPSKMAEEADTLVGAAGISPSSGPKGFELLEGSAFNMSSAQEKQRIRMALEGELAKTIMTMQGVSSAKVHINIGDDSPFADETVPSMATVSIVESRSGGFGSTGGKAVARLVQGAGGVKPENITVVNNFGQILYDGQILNQPGIGASQKLAAEIQEGRRRENVLRRSLDLAFGPGNTIAIVQVEMDMDTTVTHEVTRTPSENPTSTTQSSEELKGGGAGAPGGPSGEFSNNPVTQPTTGSQPGGSGPGEYSSNVTQKQFPENVKTTDSTKAPGEIIGMTVQVVADSKNITDLKAVEKIAQDFLGSYKGQAGFSASVTAVEFDTKAAVAQSEAASAVKGSERMQQAISLLPVLALIVVGFLVIRAITKVAAKRAPTYALAAGGALPMTADAQPDNYPTRGQPAASSEQNEVLADLPAPKGEAGQALATALDSGKIDDALRIIEEMPEDPEIKAIQSRINVPLEQIRHMAKTKPESIAMLLKGWMLEDLR
ncbi:MAG: hypothetical protein IH945_00840 [Armatimonadetes bacterium]|nr:hypothetical protein [Armatimonadota bacterium]